MCDTWPKCILGQRSPLILTEHEIKNLGAQDSPLQNKKSRDHQWQNVTNSHQNLLEYYILQLRDRCQTQPAL